MTLDFASITEKKAKLEQAIRNLEQLRSESSRLVKDELLQGSTLYYLILGIECILDIGGHIIAEEFKVSPQTNKDVIRLLGEKKVIPTDLSMRAVGMAEFRNKVIHEYADVDVKRITGYLQKAPDEFRLFERALSDFVKKKKLK